MMGSSDVSTDLKLKTLLKELFHLLRQLQDERTKGDHALLNVHRAHERIKQEQKATNYYRNKLKGFYNAAKQNTENEVEYLRKALDQVDNIIQLRDHTAVGENKKTIKRRGVLMHQLRTNAIILPLWMGPSDEAAPPLCGCTPAEPTYVAKPGDKVAARGRVKGQDDEQNDPETVEETWILAEVVTFNGNTNRYEVDDVDAPEGTEKHVLSRRRVLPLPQYKANPDTHPEALFKPGTLVMALYPQTTCFYRGIVHESPATALNDYLIMFEDHLYPEGYSPPMPVPQLYVVVCKEDRKK